MVLVIDYGMGNVGSILNMLRKVGASAELSARPEDVNRADRLVLPGVGAFDAGMRKLQQKGYIDVLNRRVIDDRIPILGICLGMQLFTRRSEEGVETGLGWLDAETIRFRFSAASAQLKVPHMGWNSVKVCHPTPLFPDPERERRFYFVHSFHVRCQAPVDVLTTTEYGAEFTSCICHNNILGVQFHPEKSHRFGLDFFNSFLSWSPV